MVKVNLTATKESAATAKHRRKAGEAAAVAELDAGAQEIFGREIVCPLTGEIIDLDSADSMIDGLERLKTTGDKIYAVQQSLRVALAAMTAGDAKTRRVKGKRRQAVVTMPDDSWDQSMLKEAFQSYPQFRDDILKIDSLGVRKVEYKQAVNTSGPPDWEMFRDMVSKANRGPTGLPTVKVEL